MRDLLGNMRLADRLLELRAQQRYLANLGGAPGDNSAWLARVRPYLDVVRGHHECSGKPILTCALECAQFATDEKKPVTALMLLAAGVELVDPTPSTDEGPR